MSISSLPQNPLLSQYMPSSHNPSYSFSQPYPSSTQAPPQIPAPQPHLSASITRILTLANFPATLKTRDLQNAFGVWEAEKGGFKIKWIDDVTALVVFADAGIAKKAYLSSLLVPPPSLVYPATIRPYDGPDAQAIIQAVNARTHGGGHRGSMAIASNGMRGLASGASMSTGMGEGNPFGVAMGMGGKGPGGYGQNQGQGQATNGFQIPQPAGFGGETVRAFGSSGGGHHVRASSVSSASAGERTTTPATRMAGPSNGNGNVTTNGAGASHHRAMSNSSATGGSWGRQSISGVLSGFGGSSNSNGASASNAFNNPNSFGSYGAGGATSGAHSLPPLPLPPVNTNLKGLGSRLTTHMEVDTPAATPMKASLSGGGYFPLSGSALAESGRSSSVTSDRSGGGAGNADGRTQASVSMEDLVSPPLEIRGGPHLEGMTSVTTSPTDKDKAQNKEASSGIVEQVGGANITTTTSATAAAPVTPRRNARTTPMTMPATRGSGSAAFGSRNGVFGGSSFGGGGGGGGGGHARRESQDAGSAEKALDEVKKALQGLGVAE